MDGIDITDSAFSLDVPNIDNIVATGGSNSTYYNIFIYIGIAILAAMIGMFVYKYYQNKNSKQDEDCPGGFCNMENAPDNK
jgi:hypothetical protein